MQAIKNLQGITTGFSGYFAILAKLTNHVQANCVAEIPNSQFAKYL